MVITMATNCIWYSLESLKKIRSLAKTKCNYHSFCINTLTRAWIIALGIRSRPAKYRRNRAGKDLSYCITSVINRGHWCATDTLPSTPFQAINRNNIITIITKDNSSHSTCADHADVQGALINCKSIVNKTQDIQLELVNNSVDLLVACSLAEHDL